MVDGSLPGFESQYISVTGDISFARRWARRSGYGFVVVDLDRVRTGVIDLSSSAERARVFGEPAGLSPGTREHTANGLSRGASERLVEQCIPRRAISGPIF